MKYSIIIPVFNKAHFTRHCLDTLRPTIQDAGDGEIIVVDNASSDETQELLAQYSWIRVIRNEVNLGFAKANNQGARAAQGEFLVLLNNDTEGVKGWLRAMLETAGDPNVGAVGAKLLYADRRVQHGGVVVGGQFLHRQSFAPFHHNYLVSEHEPDVCKEQDFQAVTGACLVTPRELYAELGGLDEGYWNGYEDVDYCFKIRKRGLRVVYQPRATLFHFESQSGVQRFRKVLWNTELLEDHWHGQIAYDAMEANLPRGLIRRATRLPRGGLTWMVFPTPPVTIVVHGAEPPAGRAEFERALRRNLVNVTGIEWACEGNAIPRVRELMEVRGSRYIVLVHGAAKLEPSWLDALVGQVESGSDCAASTTAPELLLGENVVPLAADARCTLLSLRQFPQHLRLRDFDTLDGSVADILLRAMDIERGTRGVSRAIAALPAAASDAAFRRAYGMDVAGVLVDDRDAVEARLRARVRKPRGLVSIVTLSWNAVEFTKLALASIAKYTSEPYEVVVVDNGSGADSVAYLQGIDDPHVRVIYNAENKGYAAGNNQGIAASHGEYVVLLNNDVIVTEHWLDDLLEPFHRIPSIGVTAPRSNRVAGSQQVTDASYSDEAGVHVYARKRRDTWRRGGYITERAIGLCLCIDRRVITEVGGFDEGYGMGNFEDDDLCIRIRGAGYGIYVCDDVFIHHFGSRSFVANNVDYKASMERNWARFARKWGYSTATPEQGYEPRSASFAGFIRERHYIPLPAVAAIAEEDGGSRPLMILHATVKNDAEWEVVAGFVKRFVRAFKASDGIALAIGAFGDPSASVIGRRIEKVIERLGIAAEDAPDISISDEEALDDWLGRLEADRVEDIASLGDRSPSALRRLLRTIA